MGQGLAGLELPASEQVHAPQQPRVGAPGREGDQEARKKKMFALM